MTSDPKAVEQERKSFEKDILARYASLLAQLMSVGVITDKEAAHVATPNMDLYIFDKQGLRR